MPAKDNPLPSVWTRPGKREQPALSREQIVAEAVVLLDADGIEALSMRRLGAKLGAGATSLYRHVASKDELMELVVDKVYGEIEVTVPDDPDDWRTAIEGFAHTLRATILRHPWIATALGQTGMAYLGPNIMRMTDGTLGVLETAGFPLLAADRTISLVSAYVIGFSTNEAAWLTVVARSGLSEQEWLERLRPAAEAAAQPYPRLRALYAAAWNTDEDQFTDGLTSILDSVATRYRAASGSPRT
ncbi:MAG TPA: TetR/AcrR family transcriptional regulator [Asanoa sp.]|jgi:AcrR family transcriptional regulator|nr:TetR/AcrR family transcriptional regulator [Asanoa sp.]